MPAPNAITWAWNTPPVGGTGRHPLQVLPGVHRMPGRAVVVEQREQASTSVRAHQHRRRGAVLEAELEDRVQVAEDREGLHVGFVDDTTARIPAMPDRPDHDDDLDAAETGRG